VAEFVSKPRVGEGIVPSDPRDLTTKEYVDGRKLEDLANVDLAGVAPGDLIAFDGEDWLPTSNPAVSSIFFDTVSPTDLTDDGQISWDDLDRALAYQSNGIKIDIAQENVVLIRNNTGSQLNKGTSVCVAGASANRLSVVPSDASPGQQGCRTLGLVMQNIPNNNFGLVSTFGLVRGINTNSFNEGDELFISTTPGVLSNQPPVSPARRVTVGYVVTKGTQGSIFVTIRRGLWLREIDDVSVESPASGDTIIFDGESGVFINAPVPVGPTGPTGPQGDVGDPGVVIDDTPPENTDLLWIDTTSAGGDISTSAVQTVEHGSDANYTRPAILSVYWKGSVAPANGANGDLWYDTTGDA